MKSPIDSPQPTRVHRTTVAPVAYTVLALAVFVPVFTLAQSKPLMTIEEDVQAFAISPSNAIVFATQRIKRIKKALVEHDDFWTADDGGHKKKIVDGEKFMPDDRQLSYQVESLVWSPDSRRIVVKMDTSEIAQPQGTVVMQLDTQQSVRPNTVLYLMDSEGHEITVQGSKSRFVEGAYNGAWSADGSTLLYMSKPNGNFGEMASLRPSDGKTTALFPNHHFRAVVWDTKRDHAFGIEESLTRLGLPKLERLDISTQGIAELFPVEEFAGYLSVSPSGNKIGFFRDGDTLEVHDLTSKQKPVQVRVAIGEFQWSKDELSVLLKRGDPQQSSDLLWVGLYSGQFDPFFHSLEYHQFQIAPDGQTIAVTQPGRRALSLFPLH